MYRLVKIDEQPTGSYCTIPSGVMRTDGVRILGGARHVEEWFPRGAIPDTGGA